MKYLLISICLGLLILAHTQSVSAKTICFQGSGATWIFSGDNDDDLSFSGTTLNGEVAPPVRASLVKDSEGNYHLAFDNPRTSTHDSITLVQVNCGSVPAVGPAVDRPSGSPVIPDPLP